MHTTRALRQIYTALRNRLPVAPISPLAAANLLCAEHPCADTGVVAHLVGCVEGNGILLSMSSVLALIHRGYCRSPACCFDDACSNAISQWGPMEETLFTALCINLRRLGQEKDVAWSEILTGYPNATDSQDAHDDASCEFLQRLLQLLEDVASFVHYSSLTLKTPRLQLIGVSISPILRVVEREWCRVVQLTHTGSVALAQLQNLGHLAGRCLRLYGGCLVSCHRILCEMMLTGASASSEMQRQTKDREEFLRMCIARDVLLEIRPSLVGFLSRRRCDMEQWTGPIERWIEIIVQLAETTAADAARLLSVDGCSYCRSSGSVSSRDVELRSGQVDVLHALALCLAMYHHTIVKDCPSMDDIVASSSPIPIVQRGLDAIRNLLEATTAAMETKNGGMSHRCGSSLTVWDWCKCCEAAHVLHVLSALCTATSSFLSAAGADRIWKRLLLDALYRLTCPIPSNGDGEVAALPVDFYVTLVRAFQLQWVTQNSAFFAFYDELWNAARTAFPRSLRQAQLPTRLVLSLLEALSYMLHLEWKSSAKEAVAQIKAVREIRDNCLSYFSHQLEANDVVLDVDIANGLLHIAAAINRAEQFSASASLFLNHKILLNRLMKLLLPVDCGLQRLLGHSVADSRKKEEEGEEEAEWSDLAAISGGAYWFFCDACLQTVVWQNRWMGLGFPGICNCTLRRRDTAETLVAYVEFLGPLLVHDKREDCVDPEDQPFASLQSVYKVATATTTATTSLFFSVSAGALSPQKGGNAEATVSSGPHNTSFFLFCHQQLLLLPPHDLQLSYGRRMLRALFTISPTLFALVPELPLLLLRRLLPTTDINTESLSKDVDEGVKGIVEKADACDLWELLLWTSATAMARAGRNSLLEYCNRDENQTIVPAKTAANFRIEEDEYAEAVLCLLRGVDDESRDNLFYTTRQRVLHRALELAGCGDDGVHN